MPPAPPLQAVLLLTRDLLVSVSLIGMPLRPPKSDNDGAGSESPESNVTGHERVIGLNPEASPSPGAVLPFAGRVTPFHLGNTIGGGPKPTLRSSGPNQFGGQCGHSTTFVR
jgi:hypothetical protein